MVGYISFQKLAIAPINNLEPVFGRGESIDLNGVNLHLFLVKNPAGFDLVLTHILKTSDSQDINLGVAINDNIADGKDVSWLWDVSLEEFLKQQNIANVYTAGKRANDMLLRFEYAGLKDANLENSSYDLTDLVKTISESDKSKPFIVMCTYTALLDFRSKLSKKVKLSKISDAGN